MSALLVEARPGDEVIVPSFTFVSTANAFAMHGFTPIFADCRPDTLNVDEATIAPLIGPRTRAIVVMHYGGVACEMDEILALASRHSLVGRSKTTRTGCLRSTRDARSAASEHWPHRASTRRRTSPPVKAAHFC